MEHQEHVLNEADKAEVEEYFKQRELLVEEDTRDYFATDVGELTEEEKKADEVLQDMKDQLLENGQMPFLENYYDSKAKVEKSKLYNALKTMPKGAHLHYHLTASAPLNLLMDLTKESIVYYNQKKNKLKIFSKGDTEEGFTQCNLIRQNWTKEKTFDEFLKNKILLNKEDISSKHSNTIWDRFQYKFDLTFQLYNYHKFFRRILFEVLKGAIAERCYVVEFKHIFGCVIDDDQKFVDLSTELGIIQECFEKAKEIEPLFEMKLVICGLKIFGDDHIKSQLDSCLKALKETTLVAGFDLVNEEDTTPPLKTFRKLIKLAQKDNDKLSLFFHAGESSSRKNDNLYDAILLNTKRIGHGFAIENHPHLINLVKKKDICLEICPLSNMILGYVLDLRWHPGRSLMNRGVPITISADDPGFWGTEGVSLDYAYIALAWELSIKELKQLAINAIKYSSIEDKEKVGIYQSSSNTPFCVLVNLVREMSTTHRQLA